MDRHIKCQIDQYYEIWFGINDVYETWAKGCGLNVNSLFVLYLIREHQGSCTLRLICDKLLLAKQTVNTIVDGFENRGYVCRVRDQEDKRNKRILLTEEGKTFADEILTRLSAFEEQGFLQLERSQREALLESSQLLLNALKAALQEKK